MKIKIPGLPRRSDVDRQVLRSRLEEIKASIGHTNAKGTDTRVANAVIEARPDLKSVVVGQMKTLVRVTLDKTMQDVLFQVKEDPQVMEYEFQVDYQGAQMIITGDAGYRAQANRPRNKKVLTKAVKREIALALRTLFEDRRVPVPEEFINRVTDSVGKELARIYLDARITDETLPTLRSERSGDSIKKKSPSDSKKPEK